MNPVQKGLLIVFTGEGKGKTTAALGMALRAIGHNMKVGIFQFIKGKWHPGELEALKCFSTVEVFQLGNGFTFKKEDISKDIELAKRGWSIAKEAIASNRYHMVILDELNYVIHYGFIEEEEVLDFLLVRPSNLHIVITGRYASNKIIEIADLVTEMKLLKHPFRTKNIKAQRGVEF